MNKKGASFHVIRALNIGDININSNNYWHFRHVPNAHFTGKRGIFETILMMSASKASNAWKRNTENRIFISVQSEFAETHFVYT